MSLDSEASYIHGGAVHFEALRRQVPDPLPYWESFWSKGPPVAPLPAEPRIEVEIESVEAPGGEDDRAYIAGHLLAAAAASSTPWTLTYRSRAQLGSCHGTVDKICDSA